MKLVQNKNWFDKECCFEKHELREISNQKHRDPLNANLREQYHDTLKAYKKLLNKQNKKKKMITTTQKSLSQRKMQVSDKNSFWECFKSMDDTRKDKDDS